MSGDIRSDDRGVSQIIGAIFIFAILIVSISVYQATGVPAENQEIEYDAYQETRGDMLALQANLIQSATRGITTRTPVKLSASYPARLVTINPPPPNGQLTTGPPRTVSFENVQAAAVESPNTRAYWDVPGAKTFENETNSLLFDPGYNEVDVQPIVTGGPTRMLVGPDSAVSLGGQSLVVGNRIRMLFLGGDVGASGAEESILTEPQSSAVETVAVTGQGGPMQIRFDPPQRVSAGTWRDTIGEQLVSANSRVQDVRNESNQVVIEFDGSRTYALQLAKVHVSDGETPTTDPTPTYIIAGEGNGTIVPSGKRTRLVAQVRDKFNNPVADQDVEFELTGGSATLLDENGAEVSGGTATVSTNAAGKAAQRVRVDAIDEDVFVTATIVGSSGTLTETTFRVQTPNENNPVQLAGVQFEGSTRGGNEIDLNFNNQVSEDRDITRFRMNFYQGGSPQSGTIEGQSFDVEGSAIQLDPSLTVPAGSSIGFTLNFDGYNPSSGEWFIVTVQYDTGDTAQYFAST